MLRQLAMYSICAYNVYSGANIRDYGGGLVDGCSYRYKADLRPCPRDGSFNFVASEPLASSPSENVNPQSRDWFTGVKNCFDFTQWNNPEYINTQDTATADFTVPGCGCTGVGKVNEEARKFLEKEWVAGDDTYYELMG